MDRFKKVLNALTGEFLWACILVPILAISWLGFYTIARAVGVPPVFAAGMSAAFDGVALFAARIGLKHRRKGFSGYLARITVLAFAALGAFVQSFHSDTSLWVHEHAWIVWATAPVAAVLAYELHLGWTHRKVLIRAGYTHPSAKSGFGPITWINFPRETCTEYRKVLRARRTYISVGNMRRFELEEAAQPKPKPQPKPQPKPEPQGTPGPGLHSVSDRRAQPKRRGNSSQRAIREWAVGNGFELGFRDYIPVSVLNAYRAAHREQRAS